MFGELVLRLHALTPTSMGGYDQQVTRQLDNQKLSEPPRATSIKGVWRWWVRAFAAGVAFDNGLDEVEAAMEVARNLLGFAGEGGKTKRSEFQIMAVPSLTGQSIDLSKENNYREIARIRLLRGITCTAYNIEYSFSLRVRALCQDEEKIKAGFSTMVCSLLLSGVGKISRRGFGSLSINVDSNFDEFKKEWSRIISDASKVEDVEAVKRGIREAINKTREAITPLVRGPSRERKMLPKIPSMAGKHIVEASEQYGLKELIPAKIYLARWKMNMLDALGCINDICTRTPGRWLQQKLPRKRTLPCKLLSLTNPVRQSAAKKVRDYPACILGLPREAKRRGYIIAENDVKRRASPVIFKMLASQGNETMVLATTFISSDWPLSVEWRGKARQPIDIRLDERKIAKVMEKVREHLGQYGFKEVWPELWEA